MKNIQDLKNKMGGWKELAKFNGTSYAAVEVWKRRGVPARALIKLRHAGIITEKEMFEMAGIE